MSTTINSRHSPSPPHIALFPGAGMGHLIPFLRLAAMFASRKCIVTLIVVQPTISNAESTHTTNFFATHPNINRLDFHINPYNYPNNRDPFFVQFEAISQSVHLLPPLLSALSPPLSAIFSDFVVATSVSRITDELYIVCTTSARFFSLLAYLPRLTVENYDKTISNQVEIPGLSPLLISTIPPPFFNPNDLFASVAASNVPSLSKAKGILLNTFDWFESEAISALNSGKVLSYISPVIPIGPFEPLDFEKGHHLAWLDEQPNESVVYVSFGSRTAMSKDQLRELGDGLERSGHRFLWILKGTKVDKDDKEEVEEMLGDSFIERTKAKGLVVKGWVNQEEILAHKAIGCFVSHCGWNSVIEAARRGIPVLCWPLHGDQKINAEVVEKAGLGLWIREWGWGGERLVMGDEVGEKISEVIENEELRAKAKTVGEEANKSGTVGGSSENAVNGVIKILKSKQLE